MDRDRWNQYSNQIDMDQWKHQTHYWWTIQVHLMRRERKFSIFKIMKKTSKDNKVEWSAHSKTRIQQDLCFLEKKILMRLLGTETCRTQTHLTLLKKMKGKLEKRMKQCQSWITSDRNPCRRRTIFSLLKNSQFKHFLDSLMRLLFTPILLMQTCNSNSSWIQSKISIKLQ